MDFDQIRAQLITSTQSALPQHLKRLEWSRATLEAYQLERLRFLLTLAKQKCPWYQERLSHITPETFTLSDLNCLPILTKEDVMDHWDDLITIPGLTKQIAENHLEDFRQNKISNPYFDDQYLFIATGGSSGRRGLFIWDPHFLNETACINYRYLIHHEHKMDYTGPQRMAVIEAPTLLHGSQHLFTINVTPHIKVKSLEVTNTIDNNCKILSAFQPNYLVGFASNVTDIAHAQLQGKLSISPRWVSTNSELLDKDMRNIIHQAWGIEACNSWGSVEIGSVAMEDNIHDGIILAEDAVIIELVDDNYQPVANNALASKILATCLYNHSMPLIRYVIEDSIQITDSNVAFPAYRAIQSIAGRTTDWFQYPNCKIPPIAFRDILALSKEIDEYQIIQTQDGAIFKLICNSKPNLEEIKTRTEENLIKAGLSHPNIIIQVVNELPRNPETGKIKRFIPLK